MTRSRFGAVLLLVLRRWIGIIGPFEARPENKAGGTISVVAHVQFTDGSRRSGRGTFELKPC